TGPRPTRRAPSRTRAGEPPRPRRRRADRWAAAGRSGAARPPSPPALVARRRGAAEMAAAAPAVAGALPVWERAARQARAARHREPATPAIRRVLAATRPPVTVPER